MAISNLGIVDKLTINYILERVSQEEIMERYLKIKVTSKTLFANSCFSPFRKDTKPTCNYYYTINEETGYAKLRFRDWNGTFKGDCFDAASAILKIDTKTAQSFNLLLHKIASDFKIHKYKDGSEVKKLETFYTSYKTKNSLKVFKIEPRAMNSYDHKFWTEINGIPQNTLRLGNVYMVKNLYIQNENGDLEQCYRYRSTDPAYAYYGGKLNGIGLWKIYYPYRKLRRFQTNHAFLYGRQFFKPAPFGLITKGYKDVLSYSVFDISTVSVAAETHLLTTDEIFDLKKDVDILFTNFDYDKAGILLAQKYKKVHNIYPLMFTKGRFGKPDFGSKDFSDYRAINGHDKTQKLIDIVTNNFEEELQYFLEYNYQSLKNIK